MYLSRTRPYKGSQYYASVPAAINNKDHDFRKYKIKLINQSISRSRCQSLGGTVTREQDSSKKPLLRSQ